MSRFDIGPVCGLTGCTDPKETTVTIPGKGKRAVCQGCLEELRVNGGVEIDA